MDIYSLGAVIAGLSFTAYGIKKYVELRVKESKAIEQVAQKKGKGKTITDYIDDLPMAIQQAEQLYTEQLQILQQQAIKAVNEKKMTEKEAQERISATMKPLKERLDFLYNVRKYEPIARVGASIGDNALEVINKTVEGMM